MANDASVMAPKPGSVPAAVLRTHPIARHNGKTFGRDVPDGGRSITRDFYLKSFAHHTGMTLAEARNHLDGWDGK